MDCRLKELQARYGIKNKDIAEKIGKSPASVIYKRKNNSWKLSEMLIVKNLFEERTDKKFTLDDIFLP